MDGPVFDGLEDYLARIDDPALGIDEHTLLFMRGAGPIGYLGSCEIVNMRPPTYYCFVSFSEADLTQACWQAHCSCIDYQKAVSTRWLVKLTESKLTKQYYLLKRETWSLPCISDGRQSGTSASPSILNASPEAAVGGGLALLKTGDRVRIDLTKRTANILISNEELEKRRQEMEQSGGYTYPESQTSWQEIYREHVDQLSNGMVLKNAVKYQRIAQTKGIPREDFWSPLELPPPQEARSKPTTMRRTLWVV
jgi:dihydroxy-acid dehydratase